MRALVLAHTWLRAGFLATIALLWAIGSLAPSVYVALLAGSSVMAAWGNAGEYTLLSELGGPEGRLGANALSSAQVALAAIIWGAPCSRVSAPRSVLPSRATASASAAGRVARTQPASAHSRCSADRRGKRRRKSEPEGARKRSGPKTYLSRGAVRSTVAPPPEWNRSCTARPRPDR